MADGHELSEETVARLNPRSFFQTFLNVRENSEGYDGTAVSSDRNRTVKALIKPLRSCYGGRSEGLCATIPRGSLGRLMLEFAWNKSTLNKTALSHENNINVFRHQENEINYTDASGDELNSTVDSDVAVDGGKELEFFLSSGQSSSNKLLLDTNKTKGFDSSIPELSVPASMPEGINSNNSSSRWDNNYCVQTETISINGCCDGVDEGEMFSCKDYGDGGENNEDVDEYDISVSDDINIGDDDDVDYESDKEQDITGTGTYASQLSVCPNSAVSKTTPGSDNDEILSVTSESHGSIGSNICSKDTGVCEGMKAVEQGKFCDNSGFENHCVNVCSNQNTYAGGFHQRTPKQMATDILKQSEGRQPSTSYKSQSSSLTKMADRLLKFKLSLLESILLESENQIDNNLDDYQLLGKLAVLMGSYTKSNTQVVQLTHSLSVGFFNFLDGTVKPYEYSEAITNQFLPTIETRPLAQLIEELDVNFRKHSVLSKDVSISAPNTFSMSDGPVAWVITSPGLGVGLDRQLKRILGTLLEETSLMITDTQKQCNGQNSLKWKYLLMLLDEYRRTEDGFPVTEVYELDVGGKHQLVNFEIL